MYFDDIKEDESNQWHIDSSHYLNNTIDGSVKIEPFTIIESDVEIGANTIIGPNTFIRSGTKIGKDCKIGGNCVIEGNGVVIGDRVRIGTHCNIGWGVIIEDLVFIAGHMTGANDSVISYARDDLDLKPYKIKYGARIGLHCVIGANVIIGREALVGMGSVVTKDVREFSVVYGNPARFHKVVDVDEVLGNED